MEMRTERRANDEYMTPQALAVAIVSRVLSSTDALLKAEAKVLEPGCGTGNFVRAVRVQAPGVQIMAVDINPAREAQALAAGATVVTTGDFLGPEWAQPAPPFDLIIGNPPYSLAEEFVERSCGMAPVVCFLLRAAFRAGRARWKPGGLFRLFPPTLSWPVVPRPSFTGNGTEHSEYEVFLWGPIMRGVEKRIEPIIWR